MNDRARAIAILKQARDLLADRLTQRIVDEGEALLADAAGDSFLGEIENLYEQIGGRLSHVGQILSHLPAQPEPVSESHDASAAELLALPSPEHLAGSDHSPHAVAFDLPSATLVQDVATPPVTWAAFAAQAHAGDIHAAARTLSLLCELDADRSLRCTQHFVERLAQDPFFIQRAKQLKHELQGDQFNAALMLLYECFALVGMEAVGVLQTLRLRVGNEA